MIKFYWLFVLPIFSKIENEYFKNKLPKNETAIDELTHSLRRLLNGETKAEDEIAQFRYISDRSMGLLKRNFIPDLTTIFIRGGGDCSCLAWTLYKFMKLTKRDCELYMIMNGMDLRTCHIICVWESDEGLYICYSAGVYMSFTSFDKIIDYFEAKRNYKKIKVYRWDKKPYKLKGGKWRG